MKWFGWYQVAFERELASELTPVSIGDLSLVIVRANDHIRCFHAACPHRGANLAYGRYQDGAIICPFHGYSVLLGESNGGLCAREFSVLLVGGLVLVLLSRNKDNGLTRLLTDLDKTHYFIPGFALVVNTAAEMVIENAFDASHFKPVHGIRNTPAFSVQESLSGEFSVTGRFEIPPSEWQRDKGGDTFVADYTATAYSPCVVVSKLMGKSPYWTITCATPMPDGACVVRLSIAVPPIDGTPPDERRCQYLLRQKQDGLEADKRIWESIVIGSRTSFIPGDEVVEAFQAYCATFAGEGVE